MKKPQDVPAAGGQLHYRDVGDYLDRQTKLTILGDHVEGARGNDILDEVQWEQITPNRYGDWINQRSDNFAAYTPAHSHDEASMFELRTKGLKTNRDAWNYNFSRRALERNVTRMVEFFNKEAKRFCDAHPMLKGNQTEKAAIAREFADLDTIKFSWDRADFKRLGMGLTHRVEAEKFYTGTYRPFQRQHVNFATPLNSMVYRLARVYPTAASDHLNVAIGVLDPGGAAPFTVLAVDRVPDDKVAGAGNAMTYFPRYVYEPAGRTETRRLFEVDGESTGVGSRRHNVTDKTLLSYNQLGTSIHKDDIFFYVYGILHSVGYRTSFAADLKKSLPRIPQVKSGEAFWAFSKAGRQLCDLHVDYEEIDPWPDLKIAYGDGFDPKAEGAYRVEKMRYLKIPNPDDPSKRIDDKTAVTYNSQITISGIPLRAHEYLLGSRSAIDWVMNQYQIKRHKESGIVNDPNDWAVEHDDPTYVFDLLRRVVTVSMRTLDIVESLPTLDLSEG